jgi:hypothetical protein
VTFYAIAKNMDTALVATGTQLAVNFTVDKANVGSLQQSLLPGQAHMLPATTNSWKPNGTVTVGAVVDGRNTISEWLESNNSFSRPLKLY